MKPRINDVSFGYITISHHEYNHDVVIGMDGKVSKRNKKISKEVLGTSHYISFEEIELIYNEEIKLYIIGSGQAGVLKLSDEAKTFLNENEAEWIIKKKNRQLGFSMLPADLL